MSASYEPTTALRRDAEHYRSDAAKLSRGRQDRSEDLRAISDILLSANALFDRIFAHDALNQKAWFESAGTNDKKREEVSRQLREALKEVLVASNAVLLHVESLEQRAGRIDGGDQLRERIAAAQAELTDDSEFFGDVSKLAKHAIDDHRSGRVEDFPNDESR